MAEEVAEPAEKKEGEEEAESFPPLQKRPKAKVRHAHHGGAWKVAYADFITTMMALFLLLWLISSSDQSSKAMLSLYFRDPGIFENPQGSNMVPGSGAAVKTKPAPILEVSGSGGGGQRNTENTINMEAMARALHKSTARSSSSRGLERQANMLATRDGFQVQLADTPENPIFLPGTAVMSRTAEEAVESMALVIMAMTNFSISIAGHTSLVPSPNASISNRDLSADRAQRVMQVLSARGVPPHRFMEVAGFGAMYLLDPADGAAAKNNRVVITLKNWKDDKQREGLPPLPSPGEVPGGSEGGAGGATGPAPSSPGG